MQRRSQRKVLKCPAATMTHSASRMHSHSTHRSAIASRNVSTSKLFGIEARICPEGKGSAFILAVCDLIAQSNAPEAAQQTFPVVQFCAS